MLNNSNEKLQSALLSVQLNNYESVKSFLGFNYDAVGNNFVIESGDKKSLECVQKSMDDFSKNINQKGHVFTLEVNPGNFLLSEYFMANVLSLTQDDCVSTIMESQSDETYSAWAKNLGSFFTAFEKLNDTIENHPQMNDGVLGATQILYQIAGMIGIYGEPSSNNVHNYKF